MKHDCQPNPIDTDYMVLVHDMVRLSEQIARNVHNTVSYTHLDVYKRQA